ncbi:MAG TPA: hypothetical protein VN698_08480 [Bacteroidia bacterium]|nr:hypothetical protein [Bacteroidia bacterium]
MELSSTKTKYHFLQGGGEMGELTRSYEWSKTSIDNPDCWPQSLRLTVSMMLKSKFPMFLWWGGELFNFIMMLTDQV